MQTRLKMLANADAVGWFAREVFPRVRERLPAARFRIAGARPSRSVRALAGLPAVSVLGEVPDIAEPLRSSRVAVVPLRDFFEMELLNSAVATTSRV